MKKHVADSTKKRSHKLRRDITDAERRLWSVLSRRQIGQVKFRRQVPFGPYIADFASHEARIIVELDGGQHAQNQRRDEDRTAFLEGEGYQVLQFWNNDVLENLDGVRVVIADAINGEHAAVAGHRKICGDL